MYQYGKKKERKNRNKERKGGIKQGMKMKEGRKKEEEVKEEEKEGERKRTKARRKELTCMSLIKIMFSFEKQNRHVWTQIEENAPQRSNLGKGSKKTT